MTAFKADASGIIFSENFSFVYTKYRKMNVSVAITTMLIIVSLAAGILLDDISAISIIFVIANIGIVWMVYRVLKSGKPSSFTFEQKQFEDK